MDLLVAARKAAQSVAIAASDMGQNVKAYEQKNVPAFPKGGEMTNWVYSLATAAVVSGNFGDELEVTWFRECWTKSFEELEYSNMEVPEDPLRWKRLDFALSRALQSLIYTEWRIIV